MNGLESESDVASCFYLLASIITLLSTSSAMSVAQQLRDYDIKGLLDRTLSLPIILQELLKSGKLGVPRSIQRSITTLENRLIRLDVFRMGELLSTIDPISTSKSSPQLSPQILSLGLLHIMAGLCSNDDYLAVAAPLKDRIFDILDAYVDLLPAHTGLALSVLEAWCMKTVLCGLKPCWRASHYKTVVNLVAVAIQNELHALGVIETMVLKLALNITNDNPDASVAFGEPASSDDTVLSGMVHHACERFTYLESCQTEDDTYTKTLGDLTLMINLMINIFDRNAENRKLLYITHATGNPSLTRMMATFNWHAKFIDEVSNYNH
jgi:hypothetical protein